MLLDDLKKLEKEYIEGKKEIERLEKELKKQLDGYKDKVYGTRGKFWKLVYENVENNTKDLDSLVGFIKEIKGIGFFNFSDFKANLYKIKGKDAGKVIYYKFLYLIDDNKSRCTNCLVSLIDEIKKIKDYEDFKKLTIDGYFLGSASPEFAKPLICPTCRKMLKQKEQEEYLKKIEAKNIGESISVDALKTMPYKDYLQTDHWKKMRSLALRKAGYRCQLCNCNNKPLQTHHRTYERRGEEWLSDLIVLCEDCHKKHHGIKEDF